MKQKEKGPQQKYRNMKSQQNLLDPNQSKRLIISV